jgi:predicted GIY-YIG superfamily endonuclease
MKYVYILQSIADREHFYTGITDDLRARLSKHNSGEVAHTAKYRPWRPGEAYWVSHQQETKGCDAETNDESESKTHICFGSNKRRILSFRRSKIE